MKTARIEYRPGYFNSVAYAWIPAGWAVVPDDGTPTFGCEGTPEEAEELAGAHGYSVPCEDERADHEMARASEEADRHAMETHPMTRRYGMPG